MTDTRWKPGQSANPGGRPRATVTVTLGGEAKQVSLSELARTYTVEAIDTLLAIMRDDEAARKDRRAAAVDLLDRGWGKPKQELELSGPGGGPIETATAGMSLDGLSTEELRQLETIRVKLGAEPTAD